MLENIWEDEFCCWGLLKVGFWSLEFLFKLLFGRELRRGMKLFWRIPWLLEGNDCGILWNTGGFGLISLVWFIDPKIGAWFNDPNTGGGCEPTIGYFEVFWAFYIIFALFLNYEFIFIPEGGDFDCMLSSLLD